MVIYIGIPILEILVCSSVQAKPVACVCDVSSAVVWKRLWEKYFSL
jgi:hypothetical protein